MSVYIVIIRECWEEDLTVDIYASEHNANNRRDDLQRKNKDEDVQYLVIKRQVK